MASGKRNEETEDIIQSCAEQSSHENPLEPDDYANPG